MENFLIYFAIPVTLAREKHPFKIVLFSLFFSWNFQMSCCQIHACMKSKPSFFHYSHVNITFGCWNTYPLCLANVFLYSYGRAELQVVYRHIKVVWQYYKMSLVMNETCEFIFQMLIWLCWNRINHSTNRYSETRHDSHSKTCKIKNEVKNQKGRRKIFSFSVVRYPFSVE